MCNILTIYSVKEKNNRRWERRMKRRRRGRGTIANNDYDD
jgi:hypothetical protein